MLSSGPKDALLEHCLRIHPSLSGNLSSRALSISRHPDSTLDLAHGVFDQQFYGVECRIGVIVCKKWAMRKGQSDRDVEDLGG